MSRPVATQRPRPRAKKDLRQGKTQGEANQCPRKGKRIRKARPKAKQINAEGKAREGPRQCRRQGPREDSRQDKSQGMAKGKATIEAMQGQRQSKINGK